MSKNGIKGLVGRLLNEIEKDIKLKNGFGAFDTCLPPNFNGNPTTAKLRNAVISTICHAGYYFQLHYRFNLEKIINAPTIELKEVKEILFKLALEISGSFSFIKPINNIENFGHIRLYFKILRVVIALFLDKLMEDVWHSRFNRNIKDLNNFVNYIILEKTSKDENGSPIIH